LHAAAHGAHVGRALLDPREGYAELCGYWSDQYDLSIQTAGVPIGEHDVLRGDPAGGSFMVYHLRRGVIVGATAVNAARDLRRAKALIRERGGLEGLDATVGTTV